MATRGRGLFSLYACALLKLKKSSCPKVQAQFEIYFAQMYIGAPFTKFVQIFPIRGKTWLPGGGACFPYMCIVKTSKVLVQFESYFAQMFLGVPSTMIVQMFLICSKKWLL